MSLVRGNSYSTAGFANANRDRFEVNNSVFILDATAGRGYDAYDDRHYPVEGQVRRESFGLSGKHTAWLFCALAVVLLIVMAAKYVNIRKRAYDVSILEEQVRVLSEINYDLDQKVMAAREMTHISLFASKMGMVLVEEQEVHHVTAPDTRPFAVRGVLTNENTE
ncbi:MAG: hypothetical protein IJJ80_03405 [Clostridia bacterium]|nr:hypothetical protein [Clostridia bacterium]